MNTTPDSPAHTDRRVSINADLAVFLVHIAAPDFLCLVTQELPGQNSGGQGCDSGPNVIANGMVQSWGSADPASDTTAVLVPDGYTATITKGTFSMAGQGAVRPAALDAGRGSAAGGYTNLSGGRSLKRCPSG